MFRRLVPSVLLALACVLVIGAAAPVAGALSRDAQIKQNVRLLKTYIDGYAAARSFVFPAVSIVKKGGGLTAPVWPVNPWTGKPMSRGTGHGAYAYTVSAGADSYTLSGHLSSGYYTVSGGTPAWLTAERAAEGDVAAARDQAAEFGARVIKGYVEQWGMLYNGSAPIAKDVSPTGNVGQMFPYWPTNPFTGQPMASGSQPGDFSYGPGVDGVSYYLTVKTSSGQTTLDGAVPQQLATALNNVKNKLVTADMYCLQAAIDRYAWSNNDVFPSDATKTAISPYTPDYWPLNPWFGATDMGPGTFVGTYTYAQGGAHSYTLTGHLYGGADYTVDGIWAEQLFGLRDRLKDTYCQAAAQVLKEYVEEWKSAHAGAPPTVDQMSSAGAVGAAHGWWPTGPWSASDMTNVDDRGDFQYTVGAGNAYTLTVRQAPISPFSEYYTPQ